MSGRGDVLVARNRTGRTTWIRIHAESNDRRADLGGSRWPAVGATHLPPPTLSCRVCSRCGVGGRKVQGSGVALNLWAGQDAPPRDDDCRKFGGAQNKTEHHGKDRGIFLGPRTQDVLRSWLKEDAEAYLFSPAEAAEERWVRRHPERKLPITPSELAKGRKESPRVAAGERCARVSYWQAVPRACEKAGVSRWTPLQLRQTAATLIRSAYRLEAAQVVLGHEKADTTQVHAERDLAKAREVMAANG